MIKFQCPFTRQRYLFLLAASRTSCSNIYQNANTETRGTVNSQVTARRDTRRKLQLPLPLQLAARMPTPLLRFRECPAEAPDMGIWVS